MRESTQPGTFREVDWGAYESSGRLIGLRTLLFLGSVASLAAVFLYDYLVVPTGLTLPFGFSPSRLEWLTLLSLFVILYYVVWPLAANRSLTRRYWLRLRRRPIALAAFAYLVCFAVIAVIGPELLADRTEAVWTGDPRPRGNFLAQPPVFASVEVGLGNDLTLRCAGEVRNGRCHGTFAHPLGTSRNGADVLTAVIDGSRTVFQIGLITAVLFVPLAALVGTTAAYNGGWVDEVLMRYVDLQQVIPAFLVYLLWEFLYGPSLFAIVVLFGLLDWGRIARQVRADAARKRDAGYLLAARDAGATPADAVRRHLLPNVASTLVSAVVRQVPFVLIAVVTLNFLGAVPSTAPAWGGVIKLGLGSFGGGRPLWWTILAPLVALATTVGALSVLGSAFRDILAPSDS